MTAQPKNSTDDPLVDAVLPAIEEFAEIATVASPILAAAAAAAAALKAFLDTMAAARRLDAQSMVGKAQAIADRIAARAQKAAGLGPASYPQ